ncbi:MAG: hypothetical protein HKP11_04985, partial [Flavobacteriaceae bacterium]|nr:hypothetical protein [Flavobacteriaceae bacterium]
MKNNVLYPGILSLLMFTFLFTSCSKDEAADEVTTSSTADLVFVEESTQVSQAEVTSD